MPPGVHLIDTPDDPAADDESGNTMATNGSAAGRRLGGLALTVAATLLAVGCSSSGSDGGGTADGTSAPSTEAGTGGGATATTASGAGSPATPGAPIASTEGYGIDDTSGADIPLRIDIVALEPASNDTVLLRFAVTNTSETLNLPVGNAMGAGVLQDDVSGVSLIDLSQNLRYLVLVDDDSNCLCTETETNAQLVPGQTREFEARFPAPPASTTAVDVQVGPFGTVHDVPLGGGDA